MAKTPKKLVHWALEVSMSDFGSPFSEGSSQADSTCSLQYINSQLIAHGFTYKPGLSLEGTNKDDAGKVVKCLLAMLSQRIDDMSRTEDLSTKIRTMSYDHERLLTMYRTATEKVANAEREANLHKSRLATVNRSLQSTENAHKQTTSELQRTRTALQAVRTAHATEIKKLEKEKERALDRWNKLADQQLKAGPSSAGLRFANAAVVDAPDVQVRGKGKGFLEVAAEQAQEARDALFHENMRLKGLLLSTANELRRLMHTAQCIAGSETVDEPPVVTTSELFPMAPADAPNMKFASLTADLRDAIEALGQPGASNQSSTSQNDTKAREREAGRAAKDKEEIYRLSGAVDTLRQQLKASQEESETYAQQVRELFDKLAAEEQAAREAEPSIDLLTLDEEKQRLGKQKEELDADRRKFTEAAVRLGKEKAALESDRIKFLEEKRAWQVDAMLSHLPPTPQPEPKPPSPVPIDPPPIPALVFEQPRSPRRGTRGSPRKSKVVGVPVGGGKKRAMPASPQRKARDKVASSSRVIPAYETEVIPPSPSFPPLPSFKTTLACPTLAEKTHPHKIASAFVLPPPSPAAQLPPKEALLSTTLIPSSSSDIPADSQRAESSASSSKTSAPAPSSSGHPPETDAPAGTVPETPNARRPFPMAKPFAQRMIHAYSPAKPSPLSRILLMANSPESPPGPSMAPLAESDESGPEVSPTPASRPYPHGQGHGPTMSLAAELGLPEEDDENPMLDRHALGEDPFPRPTSALGRKLSAAAPGAKGKAKARATTTTTTSAAAGERRVRTSATASTTSRVVGGGVVKKSSKPVAKSSMTTSAAPVPAPAPMHRTAAKSGTSKAGPRRVPIESADAAPGGRVWRG